VYVVLGFVIGCGVYGCLGLICDRGLRRLRILVFF